MSLKGRDFLTLKDFSKVEILEFLDLAAELKEKKKKGIFDRMYTGKNVALIFEKTSTRTRCSFEVAAHDMGIGTTYLEPKSAQIGKKESFADTARVLSRMFDGIEYRGYGQEKVERIRSLFPQRDTYQLIAYGDSRGDKEMLDYADEKHYRPFR